VNGGDVIRDREVAIERFRRREVLRGASPRSTPLSRRLEAAAAAGTHLHWTSHSFAVAPDSPRPRSGLC